MFAYYKGWGHQNLTYSVYTKQGHFWNYGISLPFLMSATFCFLVSNLKSMDVSISIISFWGTSLLSVHSILLLIWHTEAYNKASFKANSLSNRLCNFVALGTYCFPSWLNEVCHSLINTCSFIPFQFLITISTSAKRGTGINRPARRTVAHSSRNFMFPWRMTETS